MSDPITKHIQVIYRLSAMGDVVLTTGVLSHWHADRNTKYIFITKPGLESLLENHPAISEVVCVDTSDLKGRKWMKQSRELAERFKGLALIDLHGTLRSRILARCWKGPTYRYPKFGLTRRLFHKFGWNFLRRKLESTCVPQRYALALDSIPPDAQELLPVIHLTEAEHKYARNALSESGISRPFVALHPYATHPDKAWPREHWLNLINMLDVWGMEWIVIGQDSNPLIPGHVRDFTGRTDLRQVCSLINEASVMITNDSGPMHLATAVATPVLAVFGPTSKAWGFFPQGPSDIVLQREMDCRPCSLHGKSTCSKGHACLRDISPDVVLVHLKSMLEQFSTEKSITA